MIYELRVYHCVPGKLPALVKRFEQHTLKIFEKHGFRQVGFWTTVIGESNQDFYYMLEWDSLADREKKWNAFQADKEWQEIRKSTEVDGPLVASFGNTILAPTAYSAAK